MNQTIKYISIGFAVQLATTVGAIAFWSGGLEKDVKINNGLIIKNENRINKIEDLFSQDVSQIKTDLTRIKTILEFADVDIEKKN